MPITKQSQSDFDNKSPAEQLALILKYHEEAIHDIRRDQLDIDAYQSDPNGQPIVNPPVKGPYKITDIIAQWAAGFDTSQSLSTSGSSLNPAAAGAQIAALIVGSGTFQVTINVDVTGTVTATDNNNMKLQINGVNYAPFIEYVAGDGPATVVYTINVNQIATLKVATVAASSGGGCTYTATITATAEQTPDSVVITIGDRVFYPDPSAGVFQLLGMHGIQMQNLNQPVQMTTSPTGNYAFLEILGYADYRKEDQL